MDKPDEEYDFEILKLRGEYNSEENVAAHIFCKELLNLLFHPKLLDYYCLIGTKNVDNIYLKNYIDELYEIINR